MRQNHRTAERTSSRVEGVGFAGFVARNAGPAYRYTVMLLDDPVAAQDAVHDTLMATWTAASQWPPSALDAAFGRRLVGAMRTRLRATPPSRRAAESPGEEATGRDAGSEGLVDPAALDLARALTELDPEDRLLLAERFGMPDHVEPVAVTLRGRGSLDRRVPGALAALAERLAEAPSVATAAAAAAPAPGSGSPAEPATRPGTPEALGERLRALYAERDPGEAPTQLRWRLQRSLVESEQAAAEQAEISAASDWGFPIKTVLVILIFVLAIAVASVTQLSRDQAASSLAGAAPSSVSIATVNLVTSGIEGPAVHVASTTSGFFAAYAASAQWHVAAQLCRADVLGSVGWSGTAAWVGEQTAHFEAVAADPASGRLLAAGTGVYCDAGIYTSDDGGRSWTRRPLPADVTNVPDWVSLDPSRPGHLLLASGSRLFVASNDGRRWTGQPLDATPIAVDPTGRLIAWRSGQLLDSWDEGTTWNIVGPGPDARPTQGVATAEGAYLATPDGLWWCKYGSAPQLVRSGNAFSVALAGNQAIAAGADASGTPWVATVDGVSAVDALLPPEVKALAVTGGQVATGPIGALVAFSGTSSSIVFAAFSQ